MKALYMLSLAVAIVGCVGTQSAPPASAGKSEPGYKVLANLDNQTSRTVAIQCYRENAGRFEPINGHVRLPSGIGPESGGASRVGLIPHVTLGLNDRFAIMVRLDRAPDGELAGLILLSSDETASIKNGTPADVTLRDEGIELVTGAAGPRKIRWIVPPVQVGGA